MGMLTANKPNKIHSGDTISLNCQAGQYRGVSVTVGGSPINLNGNSYSFVVKQDDSLIITYNDLPKVNVTYNVSGYNQTNGDSVIISDTVFGKPEANTTSIQLPGDTVDFTVKAGDYRNVEIYVNGLKQTLNNNKCTINFNSDKVINVVFTPWSEYEIYMYQTEELYKLAQKVINGQV